MLDSFAHFSFSRLFDPFLVILKHYGQKDTGEEKHPNYDEDEED